MDQMKNKTAFMTPRGIFCYKVMPFGLKNAGATYQRMIVNLFKDLIGKKVEVYIDDMVVKSSEEHQHLDDLQQVFDIMRKASLRLNAAKCAFSVGSGKFLGHFVTRRGIEASPDQIKTLQGIHSPRTVKDVQKLAGMDAALNRFISRSSDKCVSFFKRLRGDRTFQWDEENEQALLESKHYLQKPPVLTTPTEGEELLIYLAVSEHAVSGVLVREETGAQRPVYYVSKALLQAETRYTPLKKLLLALIVTARKLNHYFQVHPIKVVTAYPIRALLASSDLSGRVARWAVELG